MLINIETKKQVWEHDFKAMYPNTSFPQVLNDADISKLGYVNLFYPKQPTTLITQKVVDDGIEYVEDRWQVKWLVVGKSTDELASDAATVRESNKATRQVQVDAIKVTTSAGHTFDGNEVSQGRMARAIIALSTGLAPSVTWVLADNTAIKATAAELTEALALAGEAQTKIWAN
jgi:hypothetical protein